METLNAQTVENLKADGFYFAAGVIAATLKLEGNYGIHYGMRSDLEKAKKEFKAGFDFQGTLM